MPVGRQRNITMLVGRQRRGSETIHFEEERERARDNYYSKRGQWIPRLHSFNREEFVLATHTQETDHMKRRLWL